MASIQLAKAGGVYAGVPALNVKSPQTFPFSDTFVVVSRDSSAEAVASYVVTSALLTHICLRSACLYEGR